MAVNLGVSYVGVLVAAIAAVAVGFIWYRPAVFGKRWMAYIGMTDTGNPGPMVIAVGVIAALVNAWVLAVLALNLKAATLGDGIMLGVLVWLGFMATLTAAQVNFERRPWGLWVLNNGHDVIVQVLIGAIVTLVR
jgi:uncharacterized protein DUF1761